MNVEFLSGFIKEQAENEKPFLAYYTCLLPHYPWVPTPDSEDQADPLEDNEGKGDPKFYPDMVAYLDKVVGRLMTTVEEAGVAENTVFIFTADNGTDQLLKNNFGDGHVIPGGKGSMTDRGTRVPLIVRWPGQVNAGSACVDLIDFTDFLPTLCQIAGAPLLEARIHGQSFLPQLKGQPGATRSWVYIQDHNRKHLRTKDYIYASEQGLRPVTELWNSPATPFEAPLSAEQEAAEFRLKGILKKLTK